MKQIFASWLTKRLPEDLSEIYISCGAGEAQWDGFFLTEDIGAVLSIQNTGNGYRIVLTCPDAGLTDEEDWWLSPSDLGMDIEALDFGIVEGQTI